MNLATNEKLILFAGVAVLAVSLALPAIQRVMSDYDVRDVATRAADFKRDVLSSSTADGTLGESVLVDSLSPDAALAGASVGAGENAAPAASSVSARQGSAAGPIGDLRVVAEWSAAGHARMRVDETAKTKQWTWDNPRENPTALEK